MLELWKPLKITNPLLEDIFRLPIDGKVLNNGKIQSHPLIIFENSLDKTYYCIRLQTANPSTIKSNIPIDNGSYQKLSYWKNHQSVAVTKDVFIIDKEVLEANVDQNIYQETLPLNKSDKCLIINDLEQRINSIPPNLNVIKISNNLKHNLVLYTNDELIKNQLHSTLSYSNILISNKKLNYYKSNFNKSQFLNDTNTSNVEYTKQALKNIKLCINKAKKIDYTNFDYLFDPQTNTYTFHLIPSSLSDFDKTPTDLQDSKVINEYNQSQKESKASQSRSKPHNLKH
ncbi:Mbov_0400 family ICE element protein [Metamycoplasma hominis]|uniref:Mbov_0400 family ICE element protein n=1 Tax=Metamycoplasma hominis TaxID=2098 RepID=UPI0034A52B0F